MRISVVLLVMTAALAAVAGCSSGRDAVDRKLVVATIRPYALLASEIAGTRLKVEVLIPASASPHTWSPRPADVGRLTRAGLVVANGLGLEARLGSLFGEQRSKTVFAAHGDGEPDAAPDAGETVHHGVVRTTAGHDDAEGNGHGHAHHGEDPHLWTDPLLMQAFAGVLAERFAVLDPAGRDVYRANAAAFSNRILILDRELRQDSVRYRSRAVVMFHDAFARLCRRYHVEQVAILLANPGRDPSVGELVAVGKKIREKNVRALYTEPQLDGKSARVLAREYSLPVYVLDPLGLTDGITNYESLIRYNWRQLVRGFAG